MTLNSGLQVFLVGFFGGILIELVHWYAIAKMADCPITRKAPNIGSHPS